MVISHDEITPKGVVGCLGLVSFSMLILVNSITIINLNISTNFEINISYRHIIHQEMDE